MNRNLDDSTGRSVKFRNFDLEMMFVLHTCLLLSPSYNLAIKFKNKKLTKQEQTRLPVDFPQVLKTLEKFDDVSKYYPFLWIEKFGADAIQGVYSSPSVRVVSTIAANKKLSLKNDGKDWIQFLNRLDESIEGPADRLLLVIPTAMSRSELMSQMLQISKDYEFSSKSTKERIRHPDVKLRINSAHLVKLKNLFMEKLRNPTIEHWRLGVVTEFSKKLCEGIDVNGGRHASSDLEAINRDLLGKVVGRALKKFQRIMENSARGVYPSDKPITATDFDLAIMLKNLEKHERYIDKVSSKQSYEFVKMLLAEAENE